MEIITRDDYKGRAQSFESTIDISSIDTAWGHFYVDFSGYGANKWSAEQNLIQQAKDLREKLNELIEKYDS